MTAQAFLFQVERRNGTRWADLPAGVAREVAVAQPRRPAPASTAPLQPADVDARLQPARRARSQAQPAADAPARELGVDARRAAGSAAGGRCARTAAVQAAGLEAQHAKRDAPPRRPPARNSRRVGSSGRRARDAHMARENLAVLRALRPRTPGTACTRPGCCGSRRPRRSSPSGTHARTAAHDVQLALGSRRMNADLA